MSLVFNSFNDYYKAVVSTQVLVYSNIYPWLFSSQSFLSLNSENDFAYFCKL